MNNESKNKAETSAQTKSVIAADCAVNTQAQDQVRELELSSAAAENLAESCDPKRRKKVAKLKAQYQKGELHAQDSKEVAQKIIKKFDL